MGDGSGIGKRARRRGGFDRSVEDRGRRRPLYQRLDGRFLEKLWGLASSAWCVARLV